MDLKGSSRVLRVERIMKFVALTEIVDGSEMATHEIHVGCR